MKIISQYFPLFLILLTPGCFKGIMGGKGVVPSGFLDVKEATPIILDDDKANDLLWNTAIDGDVIGNVIDPVIKGSCSNVKFIELWANGVLKTAVSCIDNKFQMTLTDSDVFSNGIHALEFRTEPATITLSRTYDVFLVDPDTLITANSVPTSSIYDSFNFSVTCNRELAITVAGIKLECDETEVLTQTIPLAMGTNIINISWSDPHHNQGSRSYTIHRNPAGTPEVTAGVISATPASSIALSNCTVACDGTTVSNVSVMGFEPGVTNQGIPLSRAPATGGGGETISLGNHSYIFCERQNINGECIP